MMPWDVAPTVYFTTGFLSSFASLEIQFDNSCCTCFKKDFSRC